ncbi:MAG: 4Fe-4S single cluster domain-containing protein [Chloroflexota bacterium]
MVRHRLPGEATIRIHSIVRRSRVGGPGLRCLVHTQGCTLACPGCFNPGAQDPLGGREYGVHELAQSIIGDRGIEGVTISGGEPLQQAPAVAELLSELQAAGLTTVLYSGYTLAEITALHGSEGVLAATDVLIDGRYQATAPCHDGYRGSANQQFHFLTGRYGPQDFRPQPAAIEVEIAPDGTVSLRGFPGDEVRSRLDELLHHGGAPAAPGRRPQER